MPWTNISKVESNNEQYAAKNVTSIAAKILQMIVLQVQNLAKSVWQRGAATSKTRLERKFNRMPGWLRINVVKQKL